MDEITPGMSDHDILIILHTNVKNLMTQVNGIKDGTANTLQDHETRLRSVEKFRWQIVGGLIALQAFGDTLLYFLLKK